jgi:hypothetical protein
VELGHLELAVRGGTSQALLDRTLDPRHATEVSARSRRASSWAARAPVA